MTGGWTAVGRRGDGEMEENSLFDANPTEGHICEPFLSVVP